MEDRDFALLRRCKLFATAPEGELRGQLDRLRIGIAEYDEGRMIRTQGDLYDELLVLLEGSVAGDFRTHDGRLMRVETLSAPDALASAFLFSPQQRIPVDVTAIDAVRILRIPRESLIILASAVPSVLEGLLADIARRAEFLAAKLRMVQFKTLQERIAHYLLSQMSFQKSSSFRLPVSKRELADIVGGARQSLFRCLADLEEGAIIEQAGRTITVLQPEKLRHLAQGSD